jgi:anti-sigma B factor antagonist
LKISTYEKSQGVFVVSLEGDLDMSTSPDLRKKLLPLFEMNPKHVVVDLSGVDYVDSSGIATFVEGLQLSRRGKVRFSLAGARPSVEAIFDLAYLKEVFEMAGSVDALFKGEGKL